MGPVLTGLGVRVVLTGLGVGAVFDRAWRWGHFVTGLGVGAVFDRSWSGGGFDRAWRGDHCGYNSNLWMDLEW